MSWHAAEFFLGAGREPAKAVELLRNNAALRPNGESWAALAKALMAQGEWEGAQAALDRALATPLRSAELYEAAAELHARLGNSARSEDMAARARRLRAEGRMP
jgi:tetratricopeptide (TPR) repeat protein